MAPSPPNWQAAGSGGSRTASDSTATTAAATKFTSRWRPSDASRVLATTSATASDQSPSSAA